jgi:bacterioferritin-associated ferredoxin
LIVCSCAVISDRDIESAVVDIMSAPVALLPTPGVVFRYLNKKMACGSCAAITVATIYKAMDQLEADTRVSPYALAEARAKIAQLEAKRERRQRNIDAARNARRSPLARSTKAA